MTEKSLDEKLVMALIPAGIYVGLVNEEHPKTLQAPYLLIKGGSIKTSEIEIGEHQIQVTTPLIDCTPESLAEKLQKFRCYSKSSAEAVGKMVEGLYFLK